jgi:predicted membrane protein
MTDFQHALVGSVILMIIWHGFAKKYFRSDKDVESWKAWKDLFNQYWH